MWKRITAAAPRFAHYPGENGSRTAGHSPDAAVLISLGICRAGRRQIRQAPRRRPRPSRAPCRRGPHSRARQSRRRVAAVHMQHGTGDRRRLVAADPELSHHLSSSTRSPRPRRWTRWSRPSRSAVCVATTPRESPNERRRPPNRPAWLYRARHRRYRRNEPGHHNRLGPGRRSRVTTSRDTSEEKRCAAESRLNHLAGFSLTYLLSDRIRADPPARVVNVVSAAMSNVRPPLFGRPRPVPLDLSGVADVRELSPAKGFVPFAAYARAKLLATICGYEFADRWGSRPGGEAGLGSRELIVAWTPVRG